MSPAWRWVTGGLLVAGLLVAGRDWDRHDGPQLDQQAQSACTSVRTHERARGQAVRERAARSAVAAARASQVDGLRGDADGGFAAVAAWCSTHA